MVKRTAVALLLEGETVAAAAAAAGAGDIKLLWNCPEGTPTLGAAVVVSDLDDAAVATVASGGPATLCTFNWCSRWHQQGTVQCSSWSTGDGAYQPASPMPIHLHAAADDVEGVCHSLRRQARGAPKQQHQVHGEFCTAATAACTAAPAPVPVFLLQIQLMRPVGGFQGLVDVEPACI